jgi:uncharacterized protein
MARVMQKSKAQQIVYFDEEGRGNLPVVMRVLKQKLKSREDLRNLKLVIFTAEGEGPLVAYSNLQPFNMKMIAVTFPLSFSVQRKDGSVFQPGIPPKLKRFFDGVQVHVITPARLPFDEIEGIEGHNHTMKLIRDVVTVFAGGFSLCIQAVMVACDLGFIDAGERVIAVSGDCAGLITASTTKKFLTRQGISVNEIFCKPRNLTISRPTPKPEIIPPRPLPRISSRAEGILPFAEE